MNLEFLKKTSPGIAVLGGVSMATITYFSYKYCQDVPLEFIQNYPKCGTYTNLELLIPSVKQGLYAFAATFLVTPFMDFLIEKNKKLESIIYPTIGTTLATYAWHANLIESENPMQPTVIGGTMALMGYTLVANREDLKQKIMNILN